MKHLILPMSTIPTLEWVGDIDGHLCLLDQTRLPIEAIQLECRTVPVVEHAIKTLQVRGAPAIGIAAAYGVCIGIQDSLATEISLYQSLAHTISVLAASRPTAVNLFTALVASLVIKLTATASALPNDSSEPEIVL